MNHGTRVLRAVAAACASLLAVEAYAQTAPAPAGMDALLLPPPPAQQAAPALAYPAPAGVPVQPGAAPAPGTPYNQGDAAFDAALRSIAPLTPSQVEEMRRTLDQVDRAQGMPLSPVQPVTRSIKVSFKSGERPAMVRVAPGWISTMTFSDVTGQPWPVEVVTNGNPNAYDVKSSGPEQGSNIVTISAKMAHVPSNLAITLLGAKVPLLVTLDPNGGQVDYRVDAQLDQRGPNAAYDVISGNSLPPTGDSVMLAFLDGVPPEGARKMKTNSSDVEAFLYQENLYVRTARSLLSPAYVGKQSNVSGVNVYVLPEGPPVLIVSDSGRMGTVTVSR